MRVTSYGQSDIGKKRKNNEDNFLIDHDIYLYVVCDGMGGHAGGEQASATAVETIGDVLKTLSSSRNLTFSYSEKDFPEAVNMLKYAIKKASNLIYEKSKNDPILKGMGTTCTALWLRNNQVYIAHVGDSRAYLVRGRTIQQVTEDHSWVREQVKAGLLSLEEAKLHSYKNIITRSVGFEEDVKIDTFTKDIQPGDTYLLCSDGMSNNVKDEDILKIITTSPVKEACLRLISSAIENGGDDNITVIVVTIEA